MCRTMQPCEISEMLRKMSECRLKAREAIQAMHALIARVSASMREETLHERQPPYMLTTEELQDVTGRC